MNITKILLCTFFTINLTNAMQKPMGLNIISYNNIQYIPTNVVVNIQNSDTQSPAHKKTKMTEENSSFEHTFKFQKTREWAESIWARINILDNQKPSLDILQEKTTLLGLLKNFYNIQNPLDQEIRRSIIRTRLKTHKQYAQLYKEQNPPNICEPDLQEDDLMLKKIYIPSDKEVHEVMAKKIPTLHIPSDQEVREVMKEKYPKIKIKQPFKK